jgi:hypothetical protein
MKKKISQTSPSDLNTLLYNVGNYKPIIENTIQDILTKFVIIIIEYMRLIAEKITMKNKPYYKFIFQRGLETLIHVFSILFYYTKNLELTFYHTQKAIYYYIEFIEQISDENVSFLNLSSRDAVLFVYKKTIYEINNEYKRNIIEPNINEQNLLVFFNSYKYIYKNIIQFIINHKDFKYETKIEYINLCCDSIELISKQLNKSKMNKKTNDCIYLFISVLSDKKIEIDDFFKLLDNFITKINLIKKLDDMKIKQNIYDSELNNFINNNELDNLVEWIFA